MCMCIVQRTGYELFTKTPAVCQAIGNVLHMVVLHHFGAHAFPPPQRLHSTRCKLLCLLHSKFEFGLRQ